MKRLAFFCFFYCSSECGSAVRGVAGVGWYRLVGSRRPPPWTEDMTERREREQRVRAHLYGETCRGRAEQGQEPVILAVQRSTRHPMTATGAKGKHPRPDGKGAALTGRRCEVAAAATSAASTRTAEITNCRRERALGPEGFPWRPGGSPHRTSGSAPASGRRI